MELFTPRPALPVCHPPLQRYDVAHETAEPLGEGLQMILPLDWGATLRTARMASFRNQLIPLGVRRQFPVDRLDGRFCLGELDRGASPGWGVSTGIQFSPGMVIENSPAVAVWWCARQLTQ
jgi:hypothetical protein